MFGRNNDQTTVFTKPFGGRVEIKGFDIRQPSHVELARKALDNCRGGTISFGVGRFARDD
jgi:hypothetical protein